MQYIRLSDLRKQFTEFEFPLSPNETDRFRDAFYAGEFAKQAPVHESEQWIANLANETFVLFMQWTEQESDLLEVLSGGVIRHPFRNRSNLKQHALFRKYQAFITPFLYPQLEKGLRNTSLETWNAGLTYVPLLEERESGLIQEIIYDQLKDNQELLERGIAKAVSEEALVRELQPYLRPVFFEMLNLFDKSFYRVKTNWMEVLIGVSAHRFSSRRLILHIARQLHQLELNPDHVQELKELDQDIKTGAVEVEASYFPWKRAIILGVCVVLICGLMYFIWSVPTTSSAREEMENKTSYMSFTEEERKVMDSLLSQAKEEQQQPSDVIDEQILPYVGIDLVLKEPWKNETIRDLFAVWETQDSTSQAPQPSESKPESRTFPATNRLQSKPGNILAGFRNDTDQSVMILVFRNEHQHVVYSQYVEKQKVIDLKLEPGEYLVVLPGTKVPKNLSPRKLPFEQIDSHFYEHMNNSYIVSSKSPQKVKLVWKEVNGRDFYLFDLNQALER